MQNHNISKLIDELETRISMAKTVHYRETELKDKGLSYHVGSLESSWGKYVAYSHILKQIKKIFPDSE